MGTPPNFRVAQVPAAWATGTEPSNLTSNQSDTTNNHRQTASQNESSFWNMPIQRTSGMADSSKSVKDMYKDWLSGQEEDARIIFNERTGEVEQSQDEVIESAHRTDNVMSRAQRALALISTHVGQFSDESLKTDVATLSSLVDELSRDLVAERASGRTLEENQIRTTNVACRARRLAEERAKVDSDPDLAWSRNLWQTYKRFVPRSERSQTLRSDWEAFMDSGKDQTTESTFSSAIQKALSAHHASMNSTFVGSETLPYTYYSPQSGTSSQSFASSFVPGPSSFYSKPQNFQSRIFRQ
ncbi:hypothetical protein C362_01024 [Cryptococcus neoformans Bt1]|nr:hypothetical protein C362_01024 [Cryptococcus neoformans var. grubii Bt1]